MSKISAGTTTATGLVQTSDTTGNLELQTNNGTTAVTFDTSQNASFAGDISVQGGNYLSSQPSFRNLIINGDMRIAQRGTSSSGYSSGDTYLTLDRWRSNINTAGTWTMSQDTDVPTGQGFASSMKWDCTTANASLSASSYFYATQYLEGQMLQHLKKGTSSAESVTLSFWVKSNKTGTYTVFLYDVDNTRLISKAYTVDVADTWEKKTITYAGDTTGALGNDNGRSLDVRFMLATGTDWSSGTLQTSWGANVTANRAVGQVNLADSTSNYINITGVQLEVGSQATPFEHRPYDVELQRCYRYFQKIPNYILNSYATTGATGRPHRVTMRSAPTAYWSENGTAYQVYRISDGARSGSLTSSSVPTNIYHLYYIYNPVSAWACASGSHNAVLTNMELSAEL